MVHRRRSLRIDHRQVIGQRGRVKSLVCCRIAQPPGVLAGAGTLELNNCTPNCAQGTYTGYPATVTLDGLKPYGTGLEAYSTIVVQSPSSNTTYTYTPGTVP